MPRDSVCAKQQRSRVLLHRSADVAEQDDGAPACAAPTARQRRDVAAGAKAARERRRRSTRLPRPTHRRVRRCSIFQARRDNAERTMASSPSVSSEKSRVEILSRSLHVIRPMLSGASAGVDSAPPRFGSAV